MIPIQRPTIARILAIDDTAANLALLQEILADHYEVTCVSSGEEALKAIHQSTPELVLLDIMMPGIDGYETCRQLRKISSCHSTRVVMLSAKDMTADRVAGYHAGADDFLGKPFDAEELLAKVRVHLRIKAAEEAAEAKSRALDLLQYGLEAPLAAAFNDAKEACEFPENERSAEASLAESLCSAGEWLNDLLAQCERFSLMKKGEYSLERESLDLCHAIQCVIDDHRRAALDRGVEVISFTPHAATAIVDRTEFTKALSNFVAYAIAFAPAQGSVSVYLDGCDSDWRIVIADNGCALNNAQRNDLFEPFADRESVLRGDCEGLSLAIARQVLRAHQGDVRVIEHADHGAAFEIKVPRETLLAV